MGQSSTKFEELYKENNSSPVFLRVADQAIKNHDFARAIEVLEKAALDNPAYHVIYILLGKAYAGEGNFKDALRNFKKGSELLNSDTTYQYYLREIERLRKNYEETDTQKSSFSSADYSSLLQSEKQVTPEEIHAEKDIDDHLISETLAKIYLTQGQTNEAVRVYQKLIKKYPLKKLYYESRIKDITSA